MRTSLKVFQQFLVFCQVLMSLAAPAQIAPDAEMLLQLNHTSNLTVAVFSPGNSSYAATGDEKGNVKVWEANRRLIIQNLAVPGKVTALCFSPGTDSLLVESEAGRDRMLFVFDWPTGRMLKSTPALSLEWLISDFETGMHYFRFIGRGNSILKTNFDFEPLDTTHFSGVERFDCTTVARAHTGLRVAFGYESGLVEILEPATMQMHPMPSDTFGFREYIDMKSLQKQQMKTPDAMAVQTVHFSATDAFLMATFGPSDPLGKLIADFETPKPGKVVVWAAEKEFTRRLSLFPFKFGLDDAFMVERTGELFARGCDKNIAGDEAAEPCALKCFSLAQDTELLWSADMERNSRFTLSPNEKFLIAIPRFLPGMDWFEVNRLQSSAIEAAPLQPYTGVAFFHPTAPRLCLNMPDYGWDMTSWKRTLAFEPIYFSGGIPVGSHTQSGSLVGRIFKTIEPQIENTLATILSGTSPDTFSNRFKLVLFRERKSGLIPVDTLAIFHRLSSRGAGIPEISPKLGFITIARSRQLLDVFAIGANDPDLASGISVAKGRQYQASQLGSIQIREKWQFVETFFSPDDSVLLCMLDDQLSTKPMFQIEMGRVEDMIVPKERLVSYELPTLREKWSIPLVSGARVRLAQDRIFLIDLIRNNTGSTIEIRDLKTDGHLVCAVRLPFSINEIYPDPAGDMLALTLPGSASVLLYDWLRDSLLRRLETKVGIVKALDFRPRDSLLVISGDAQFEVWHYGRGELLATLLATASGEVVYTPQGWYMASSALAAQYLSFHKGKNVWPVQQFDLLLNRPDKVIERMGYASSADIQNYRAAWEKRLEKNGLKSVSLAAKAPRAVIENRDALPFETRHPGIQLQLRIDAGDASVSSVQVWVNKMPLFPGNGKALRLKAGATAHIPVDFELSPARNRIEVQVLDVAGQQSAIASVQVHYDTLYLPNLYAVFIGMSAYQHHPPLAGPADDARLLASIYSDPAHSPAYYNRKVSLNRLLFQEVFWDTLLNESVTLEKLAELRTFFSTAKPGDYAFIYYAGHGILADSAGYFLSTWDTDFGHPEKRGMAYDSLLEVVSSCPARQKLLLVNACNAGERDKDIERFQRMKSLFPDFRQNNGAQVIAAAAGNEAAFAASPKTSCLTAFGWVLADFLLNFDPDDDAANPIDLNYDGRHTVSECAAYLARNLVRQTDGAQQPEFRQFNPDADFRLWKRWIRPSRQIVPCGQ